jgi:hypothetical protein
MSWESTFESGKLPNLNFGLPDKMFSPDHFEVVLNGESPVLVEVLRDGTPIRVLDTLRQEMVEVVDAPKLVEIKKISSFTVPEAYQVFDSAELIYDGTIARSIHASGLEPPVTEGAIKMAAAK